jgi:hypothetical protein
MKSTDVSGKLIPAGNTRMEAVLDEGARPARAKATGKAATAKGTGRTATAIALPRACARSVLDHIKEDMARRIGASLLCPPILRAWMVEIPLEHALSVAGYAPAPRATGASGAARAAGTSGAARTTGTSGTAGASAGGAAGAKGAAAASSSGEWAFLDDPKLSIEDKLFMFMKLVIQKSNDDLEEKMKAFRSGKSGASGSGAASGTSQPKKSSGGLFGVLKKAFPPLAALEKVIPNLPALVDKAVTQLGPQLLGALMIPLGAPWAAPLVQKAAAAVLPGVAEAVARAVDGGSESASGSKASGGSGGSSSGGVSKESDERLQLMDIERTMQKTNQMFATVSNILKSAHDSAMTAVNNIR